MPDNLLYLTTLDTVVWVLIGILISLILPVAVNILRKATVGLEGGRKLSVSQRIVLAWKQYGGNRYLIIFLAASFIAVTLVFLFDFKFYTHRDAALAGFAWESFINKLFGRAKD